MYNMFILQESFSLWKFILSMQIMMTSSVSIKMKYAYVLENAGWIDVEGFGI